MTRLNKLMSAALLFALAGCSGGGATSLGVLTLPGSNSISIQASIPTSHWPSRIVYFDPIGRDRAAYSEAIYGATLTVSVRNLGAEAFSVESRYSGAMAVSVPPGDTIQLPSAPFKEFRVSIVPARDKVAEIEFTFVFEKAYTSNGTWRLLAAWSDGA